MALSLDRPAPFALLWVTLSVLALVVDYATGPRIQFPVLLVVPVSLVAWRHGLRPAGVLAVLFAFARTGFRIFWGESATPEGIVVNALVRVIVFLFIAGLVAKVAAQKRALEHEVHLLHGILPICVFCKKIRNEQGEWEQLEAYVSSRSDAEFSHGMCDACAKRHYPDHFHGASQGSGGSGR